MDTNQRATPSLDYYLNVATRAGLPIASNKAGIKEMNKNKPLSKFSIEDVVRSDTRGQFDELSNERAEKVRRLAEADSKLSALYGEGGKMASNNPFLLEQALNTTTAIEGANIGATDQAVQGLEQGVQSRVDDVAAFYADLISSKTKEFEGSGGGSGTIDWDSELSQAVDIGLDDYSEDDLNAIISEYGLDL